MGASEAGGPRGAADESAGPGRPACSERAILSKARFLFLAAVGLGSSASLKILVGLMMAV